MGRSAHDTGPPPTDHPAMDERGTFHRIEDDLADSWVEEWAETGVEAIEEFGRLTGVPVLLNTSYNRREPIVASPADAVACYLQSGMDALAIGDFLAVGRKP